MIFSSVASRAENSSTTLPWRETRMGGRLLSAICTGLHFSVQIVRFAHVRKNEVRDTYELIQDRADRRTIRAFTPTANRGAFEPTMSPLSDPVVRLAILSCVIS